MYKRKECNELYILQNLFITIMLVSEDRVTNLNLHKKISLERVIVDLHNFINKTKDTPTDILLL